MKKIVLSSLIAMSLVNAGCVSSTANPVPLAQVGDETKSCDAITNEMQQMINKQLEAEGARNSQVGGNVALGVLGAFFIVPLFFMDTSNAHTVEEKAAQSRFDRLQQMAIDRKCPSVPVYQPPSAVATGDNPAAGKTERITITNPATTAVSALSFDAARDHCSETFKATNESFGNCVLKSSTTKPAVVAQIGYNQVCQNIGFEKDSAAMNSCVTQLLARPVN